MLGYSCLLPDLSSMFSSIEHLWNLRREDGRFNTSYPISPIRWAAYRNAAPLPFSEKMLAFYLHIPFCAKLCSFCEYTRMVTPSVAQQRHYLQTLRQDIMLFSEKYENVTLCGFDIGGGTPTALDFDVFAELMQLFSETIRIRRLTDDFRPSIESTFRTLTEEKARLMADAGIHRLSLGLQSSSERVLAQHNRHEISPLQMKEKLDMAHEVGLRTLNVDMMYGLRGQSYRETESDLQQIALLQPDEVTLYELRTNMLKEKSVTTAEERYRVYEALYDGLRALGYHAPFGQNTFSRREKEMGCSSYLRRRMTDGVAYKGFGISAQSMSAAGVSYNMAKNAALLPLQAESYEQGDTYLLPPKELMAKYIAISAYCGCFSLRVASEKLRGDAAALLEEPLRFCLGRGLVQQEGECIRITREGFRHYGAVFSLFHSTQDS